MAQNTELTPDSIVIYHIEGRRSLRVVWLCEELELPYRLVFKEGDIMGSMVQIRSVFPAMPMSPVVSLNNQFLVESGAILEILAARYGHGRMAPAVDSNDYPAYVQWMHFAEATLMSRIATNCFISLATRIPANALPPGYRAGIDPKDAVMMVGPEQCFRFANEFLAKHQYFGGGNFSAADIMMHYSLRGAKLMLGIDTSEYPNIHQWRQKIEARPSFTRAVNAACPGGMNEYLLPEGHPLPFKPVKPLGVFGKLVAGILLRLGKKPGS